MRIRDAQADGRPVVQIRVGPAVLVLDDLADLLTEVEQRTGETAQVMIDDVGPLLAGEITDLEGSQVTARTIRVGVWSTTDRVNLIWIRLGRDIAHVEVDRALPEARDTAVALAQIIERQRNFVPYLVDGVMYLYTLLPPLLGSLVVAVMLFFDSDLDVVGIPVAIWGPVVLVLAVGSQLLEYRRRYGGGVWLVSQWREGEAR